MQATDDAALLREYVTKRSEAAFEALVSRHASLVYSAAMRQMRDPHLAEEVSQAVFTILANKAASIGDRTILSGWLFKTTRFVALAQIRMAARRRHYEQESHMQAEPPPESADPLWEQISPLLDEALTHLGEKDRQALLLRFFDEKTLAQVGDASGAGEDAARMRVNRALEKLRKFFAKRGVASTASLLAGSLSANSVLLPPAALAKTVTAVALTKGAASGSAIPALVKGGLKLMAWTKAKTTVAVVAGTLLIGGGAGIITTETIHAVRAAYYPDLTGAWEGVMLLNDAGVGNGETAKSHVVLKLAKRNGVYTATADWIELGLKNVPMGKVIYNYPSLSIERSALRGEIWNFDINPDATEMLMDYSLHIIQPEEILLTRTATPDQILTPLTEDDFAPRAGSDLQGYWEGEIGTGTNALPVDIKIAEQADGTFQAEGDDPLEGADGAPMTVTYSRPTVTVARASGAGEFEGQINDAGTEITGAWTQDGQSLPATVKRADYQAEQVRDEEKDYTFTSQNDLQGHWKGTWIALFNKGTIKIPIRMALDIAKLPNGSYSAAIASVDQFGYDAPIPASDFQFSQPDLHGEWSSAVNAFGSSGGEIPSYDGKLENGKLVGSWHQSGGTFKMDFERSR